MGAGLETLLRLEHRFEVKRVPRFADAVPLLLTWGPDVALVDGVLLQDGDRPVLGIPSLVLSGSEVDGAGLGRKLDDARGWLRKDATPEELCAALDRLLDMPLPLIGLRRGTLVAILAGGGVVVFLAWGFLALRPPG